MPRVRHRTPALVRGRSGKQLAFQIAAISECLHRVEWARSQSGYPLTLYKKSDTSCSSAPRNVNHFLSRIDSRTRSFKALKSSTSLSQAF
jgi:hypothetical protein